MLAPGTVVDDKFEIIAALSMGGFGMIYRARQIGLDREVALKMLQARVDMEAEDVMRFEREARILSTLQHRNLVLFYGFGTFQGSLYIAMELVNGKSLEALLATNSKLPAGECIAILKQVCAALACAHAHGVVHRDLKPSNIMLCEHPEGWLAKVIDFGLAKVKVATQAAAQKLTEAGTTVGSIEYMSPEQCIGETADARADVYSAGCVFYKSLTGEAPFAGELPVIVMHQHVKQAAPRLAEKLPPDSFPIALQRVLDKAMAKVPADRYQTMYEFLEDLNAIETGGAILADVAPPPVSPRNSMLHLKPVHERQKINVLALALPPLIFIGASVFMIATGKWSMKAESRSEMSSTALLYKARALDDQIEADRQAGYEKIFEHAMGGRTRPSQLINYYATALQSNLHDHLLDSNKVADVNARLASLYFNDHQYEKARDAFLVAMNQSVQEGRFHIDLERQCLMYEACCAATRRSNQAVQTLQFIASAWSSHSHSSPGYKARYALAKAFLSAGRLHDAEREFIALEPVAPQLAEDYPGYKQDVQKLDKLLGKQ